MSLKAFHIFFVVMATLLSFGFGGWMLKWYFSGGEAVHLVMGCVSLAGGVALVWYGKIILRKLKHISYL